ncbi:MAG: NADH-quinone oxidoreductase subunit N [Zetaproteobacteria bacterium]|nr:NADH-quinone oxidoreductase subunit N [Zetaproteobacteria bacterium]
MANVVFPFPYPENLAIIFPEIIVALVAMAILIYEVFCTNHTKQASAWFSIVGCVVAGFVMLDVHVPGSSLMTFYGFFVLDNFAVYSKLLLIISTIVGILLSIDYMKKGENIGEYFALMLFALLGMMLMASAVNFVTLYLGMELMALSVYVLVGYQRDVLRSSEAALKYFILGALSSGMLLYGISFVYGATGSFDFVEMGQMIAQDDHGMRTVVLLGMLFIMAGLAFKVSVAPFHMWTPDAYEGAPTPITAFMSIAPKVAGFVIFIRVLVDVFPAMADEYVTILSWMAVLSMVVGNIAAIAQSSIKRMLAYSTIGHVGFVLLGLIAGNADGYAGILTYLTIYLVMTMGVFAMILMMRREGIQGELIEDFSGLSKTRPGYALAMGLLMFSMAGIPFLGGFWAKYAVFIAAVEAGHIVLALIGVLFSAVGAFYYIRVVKHIYFDDARVGFEFVRSPILQGVVIAASILVVIIGLFPSPIMDWCKVALQGMV